MKRFLILLVTVVVCFVISGCDAYNYPLETDMEYMVSSLGFDKKGNSISVFAEIIVVNSGDGEKAPKTQLFKGQGENVKAAVYNLNTGLAKPLMLKHCGLVVVGDGVDSGALSEVFDLLFLNKDVTQAIELVSTNSAEKLLSLKSNSNIALGYEITTALKQNSRHTGIIYKNRLYEIAASREKKSPVYVLPVFTVENENYFIDGVKVYFDTTAVLTTDQTGAFLHALMSDSFKSGEIELGSDCFDLKLSSVKYDFLYKKDRLNINVIITVDTEKEKVLLLKDAILSENISKTDIYGILDRIYAEDTELYYKIADNYGELFENSQIKFTVRGSDDE